MVRIRSWKKYGPKIPEEDIAHQTATLEEHCCAVQMIHDDLTLIYGEYNFLVVVRTYQL